MYDVMIIGAGQAGLAIGYYLKQSKKSFIIIDKANEIGVSWKKRYDSLELFTPRMYSSLPGMKLEGDAHQFPSKDEIAIYLKNYVKRFELPVQLQTEVRNVSKREGCFHLYTSQGYYQSRNLIVAIGPFQTANIPSFAKNLSHSVYQIHTSNYKNPSQLKEGNVLVVGGGNSGAQIAVELSEEKNTYLAHRKKIKYLPVTIRKKSIFWWFDKLGILKATNSSMLGRFIQKKEDIIFGYELKQAIKNNKVIEKKMVIDAKMDHVFFSDGSHLVVKNIIWATGYKSSIPWLEMEGVLDDLGRVIHHRGVTNIEGLFFIGLPWQYRRGSALLQGVGDDAKYIADRVMFYR